MRERRDLNITRIILAALALVVVGYFLYEVIRGGEPVRIAAVGDGDIIVTFADTLTWEAVQPAVEEAFQDTLHTPIPEPWFLIDRTPFERYSHFQSHKNRLLVGTLDGQGPVSGFIRNSLSEEVTRLVEEGKEFYFIKQDPMRKGQLLMLLVAPDTVSLRNAIRSRSVDLIYFFQQKMMEREMGDIAKDRKYHKKELEEKWLKEYGWTMWVQNDYMVARDSAASRFVWVRRATPSDVQRFIFVHWIENFDARLLNEKFVYRLRDSLTSTFMRTVSDSEWVEIAPYNLTTEPRAFLERYALRTYGNWRFSDKSGGGPFVNYSFYDERSKRFYMLDASIFAPRVTKLALLIQVESLLQTFRTAVGT